MWYFSWILGMGAALSLAVLNVMWLDSRSQKPLGGTSED
jgi:cytochrome bd-I ubiquinol oxidase subunit X